MDYKELQAFPTLVLFKAKQKENTHKWIKNKINYDDERKGYPYTFHKGISFYDCRLFPWQHMNPHFQQLYINAVLDRELTEDLEQCGALNWCQQLVKLEVLAVPKDGNSLLHAASTAMWSVVDEHCVLRELLLLAVTTNRNNSYKHRWWRQKLVDLRALGDGAKIIEKEWEEVVRSISSLGSAGLTRLAPQEFLESIHIYVLANILRRPIIVVTEHSSSAQGHNPNDRHIMGVYLPLEWAPIKCCKTPLILGYIHGHFCPLLREPQLRPSQQDQQELFFPLVRSDVCSLPVRFLSQQEEHRASELLQSYLIVREMTVLSGSRGGAGPVPCALLRHQPLPVEHDMVQEHFRLCEQLVHTNTPTNQRQQDAQLLQQTKVAPMRSFSEAYHRNLRNLALRQMSEGKTETLPPTRGLTMEELTWETLPHRGLSLEELTVEELPPGTARCVTKGCQGKGSPAQANLCNSCFKNYTIAEAGAELVSVHEDRLRRFVLKQNGPPLTTVGPPLNPGVPDFETNLPHPEQRHTEPTAPPAPELDLLPQEPLSMMNERCHNKCGYRCSKHTHPYCHACYDSIQATPAASSSSKRPTMGREQGMYTQAGTGQAMNDVNNPHGDLMIFSPTPSAAVGSPLAQTSCGNSTGTRLGQGQHSQVCSLGKSTSKPINPLTSGKNPAVDRKHRSPVEQSTGGMPEVDILRHENNNVAMAEQTQVIQDEVIEVSEEVPAYMNCASPFCTARVLEPARLCEKCQEVLHQAHWQNRQRLGGEKSVHTQNRVETGQPPERTAAKLRGKPCITPGCSNYGDPAHAYMCSFCYKLSLDKYEKLKREQDKAKGTQPNPTIRNKAHHAANRQPRAVPMLAANLDCLSSCAPSSSFHGGAGMHDTSPPASLMVTSKTNLSPGSLGSMHLSLEDLPSYDTGQGFTQVYDKIGQQTRAGLRKCKALSCGNFGNPSKGGYCNSCSAEREKKRLEEHIAKYGETVPDCWSTQQNSI